MRVAAAALPAGCSSRHFLPTLGLSLTPHRPHGHVPAAGALPPTVADTKRKFMEAYRFPIPSVYGAVLGELLVTQHLSRYNFNYAYSPVRPPPVRSAC